MSGIDIEGVYEPAQCLLDEACHQYETRVLKHVVPARCTSRESEITHSKVDKKLKLDSSTLPIKEPKSTPGENTSTAFNVMQCSKRRALAYEFAGLISYNAHTFYVDKLMKHLNVEPPRHYQPVSLTQILRADREVFIYCSQNAKDIRPTAGGVKPLDAMLERALADYSAAFHLMPLPSTSSPAPPRHAERADVAPPPTASWSRPSSKGRKGKGKSKTSFKGAGVAPRGFVGCVGRDNKGRNLCFDWNIKGCDKAPAGGSWDNGRHNSFKMNFYKPHSFFVAHASEMPAKE